jgi:hypothetical protein
MNRAPPNWSVLIVPLHPVFQTLDVPDFRRSWVRRVGDVDGERGQEFCGVPVVHESDFLTSVVLNRYCAMGGRRARVNPRE